MDRLQVEGPVLLGNNLRSILGKVIQMDYEAERRRLRFMNHVRVNPTTKCWEWQGCVYNKNKYGIGYGRFYWGRVNGIDTNDGAHRCSWRIFCGPIPEGKHVLHKCNNPACVCPRHLYIGTNRDNCLDRMAVGTQLKGLDAPWCKRSEENIETAKQLRLEGKTLKEVASILNVSKATLHRWADVNEDWAKTIKLTNKPRYRNVGPKKRPLNVTS